MLETLRQKSRKSHIFRAVISIVVVAALLIWTKFAIFSVVTGPKELDITADPASYEGKYVTIDAEFFLTDYVEHTTTTTKKYGGSTTSVDGHSYIAFQSVYDYETNNATWYFYSIYMNKGDQQSMYDLIDDTWDYWSDDTGTVAPPETLRVTGTWSPMSGQMQQYYEETLEEMGFEETEYDLFYFYTLETDKIGGQSIAFFWVLMAIALVLFLYFIWNAAGIFGGAYAKNLHKYLQKDTSTSMASIDADFAQAHVIGKDTWIGKTWTIWMRGTKADILVNKDLVWGYYYRRTGRHSVSEMRLFTKDKKMICIGMSEDQTQEALKYYGAEQPQMIIGYTKELEKSYQKNFNEFLELKYNPAMRAASADAYYNNGGSYGNEQV